MSQGHVKHAVECKHLLLRTFGTIIASRLFQICQIVTMCFMAKVHVFFDHVMEVIVFYWFNEWYVLQCNHMVCVLCLKGVVINWGLWGKMFMREILVIFHNHLQWKNKHHYGLSVPSKLYLISGKSLSQWSTPDTINLIWDVFYLISESINRMWS